MKKFLSVFLLFYSLTLLLLAKPTFGQGDTLINTCIRQDCDTINFSPGHLICIEKWQRPDGSTYEKPGSDTGQICTAPNPSPAPKIEPEGIYSKTIKEQNERWATPLESPTDFGRPDCKLSPFGCLTPPPEEKKKVDLTHEFSLEFLCNLPLLGGLFQALSFCRTDKTQPFFSDPAQSLPAASLVRQSLYPQGIPTVTPQAEGKYEKEEEEIVVIRPAQNDPSSSQIGLIEVLTSAPGGVFQIFKPMGLEIPNLREPENKFIYSYGGEKKEQMVPDDRLENIEGKNDFLQRALWPL